MRKPRQFACDFAGAIRSHGMRHGVCDTWPSQHPHAFGLLWNCRLVVCLQSASAPTDSRKPLQFASNFARTDRSRLACGTPSDTWHSQHPHAFGSSWELSPARPSTNTPAQACANHWSLRATLLVPFARKWPAVRRPARGTHNALTLSGFFGPLAR